MSTGYGLTIFSNLSLCGVKQNRRGHDSYDDRKVSLRRPHGNGDLGIVRASYTRRKANVTEALPLVDAYTKICPKYCSSK